MWIVTTVSWGGESKAIIELGLSDLSPLKGRSEWHPDKWWKGCMWQAKLRTLAINVCIYLKWFSELIYLLKRFKLIHFITFVELNYKQILLVYYLFSGIHIFDIIFLRCIPIKSGRMKMHARGEGMKTPNLRNKQQ